MIHLHGLTHPAERLAYTADGQLVSVGRPSNHNKPEMAVWWNLASGNVVHRREAEYVGLSPDGRYVTARDPKAGVRVYDGASTKPLATVPVGVGNKDWLAAAVAPAGDRLFVVHGDHVLWYALPAGTELLRKPRAMAGQAHFSPGGRWAFAGGKGAARFWDGRAKNKLLRVPAPRYGSPVAVGADERTAVVCRDGVVMVWDLDARRMGVELPHPQHVGTAAVAPAGDRVLTGDTAGVVRVWDATGGQELATFDFKLGAVTGLAVAPDGLTAAAGGVHGRVVVWDL